MLPVDQFYQQLQAASIDFFTGVPDSLLAPFCAYVQDHSPQHQITANEGNAVALAAGYHLSSGRLGCVYLQNSGLGNCINPLTSLTDPEVYSIPLLLLIGWRGEPGVADEPQHIKQGRITPEQLELLGIPYRILDADSHADQAIRWAQDTLKSTQAPVALLVRKNTFRPYKAQLRSGSQLTFTREAALEQLLEQVGDALVVATTGKTSREVFELRAKNQQPQQDFLMVGAMGHTASLALGVALGNPHKQVLCLDGDGSALMHLGAQSVLMQAAPPNLTYVLLDNQAHESVGGQPTPSSTLCWASFARSCGYRHIALAHDVTTLNQAWDYVHRGRAEEPGPAWIQVRLAVGSRSDLGRPTRSPEENKQAFMQVARHGA